MGRNMAPGSPLFSVTDPLQLDPDWTCSVPLLAFEEALEQSVFRSGLTRSDWLKRLAHQLHRPRLLPLLWLLPKGWKLAPADLPQRVQSLGGLVERELLTPALLGAVADGLPHLLPEENGAIGRWSGAPEVNLPTSLEQLLRLDPALSDPAEANGDSADAGHLSGGLIWHNIGLNHEQSAGERQRNALTARVLNRLSANGLGGVPWQIDGASSCRSWFTQLQQSGWMLRAQLRASVASFGLGASLPKSGQPTPGWSQVPLALPIRTGLLGDDGQEIQSLLPHSCLELEWRKGEDLLRLQYYQGTEGLCGWEALNDLHRPWQNDRDNGTICYFGEPFEGERLLDVMDLCELVALIHNQESEDDGLWLGGYGALGFCIDSSAVLQQALDGRCDLFPCLLGGIWRERLLHRARRLQQQLNPQHEFQHRALQRYCQAITALPHDGFCFGETRRDAQRRLKACQPQSSPFRLAQQALLL